MAVALRCLSGLIPPKNHVKFHYRLRFFFIWLLEGDGVNKKIRCCSNCGVVYSGPVCLHRSTARNDNKMEVMRCREGRGSKLAGASLLKE